jgi:hypothetical protein
MFRRRKGNLGLPLVALLFVGGALLCGLVTFCSSLQAAYRVARLTPVSLAELLASQPGQEVLIEGTISAENPVRLAAYGFVTYLREDRETENDEGTPSPGSWLLRERVTPPLFLDLSGSLVQIVNDDYDLADAETIEVENGFERYSGTRYKGFKIGTPVIAVGSVVASQEVPQIRAEFIARGKKASYVAGQRSGGLFFCLGSVLVAGLGGLVLLWNRLRWLLSRWR